MVRFGAVYTNKLESTDVTNVILGKKIDRIDYSHNKIEKIKNEINWACCNDLRDTEALQGGFIDLSYNLFLETSTCIRLPGSIRNVLGSM
jgi:hypothetical protein